MDSEIKLKVRGPAILVLVAAAHLAHAPPSRGEDQVPETASLHGVVLATDARPLTGIYSMEFRYFGDSGIEPAFAEVQPAVMVVAGHFDVELGTGTPLGEFAGHRSLQQVFAANAEVQLEVVIDGRVQEPRIRILPAGHSQRSRTQLSGAISTDDDRHWKGYDSASTATAVQAATLRPSGTNDPKTTPDTKNHETNPFLIAVVSLGVSTAVRDLPTIDPAFRPEVAVDEINPPRHEDLFDEDGNRFGTQTPAIADPLAPAAAGPAILASTPALTVGFEGIGNVNGLLPPDTEGAVGPNHYVQVVNLSYAVYSKTGTLLAGPSNTNSLWSGVSGPCQTDNDGDAIFLYDEHAGRWVLTQFAVSTGQAVCFAVSTTGDPTGTYNLYQVNTQRFPDYFKLGVWPDPSNNAYFMATNSGFRGQYDVYAVDRSNMLAGSAARASQFFQNYPNLLMPADLDGPNLPPAGSPGLFYTFRDGGESYFGSPPTDSLDLYKFQVDWTTPANSTFTLAQQFTPPNFAQFNWTVCGLFVSNCLPQPDTSVTIDSASWWPMQRLQYRNFGGHETLAGSWTVDVTGTPNHAAPRWFELRRSGGAWSIEAQGTFAPDALHRWMPSVAVDGSGNMALGYSVGSSGVYPSLRYATRLAGSATFQNEAVMMAGSGSQTHGSGRWGDYSSMEVDPSDNCTFWFTSEYIATTGSANWQTRVGAFTLSACGALTSTPTSHEVCTGAGSVGYDVTLLKRFVGTTNLSLTGCPTGASCAFSVNPVINPATTSTLTVSGLAGVAAGDYVLQVTATDAGDGSNTADIPLDLVLSDSLPPAPTLVAPLNGATNVDIVPTLEWTASAQALDYDLEVATDPGFLSIVESQTGLTGLSHTLASLAATTTYYWRVRGTSLCGDGAWSTTFSFTTRSLPPILLVDDDDNNPDVRSYYTDVLDAMGLLYDIWDTNNSDSEPDATLMLAYEQIVWFTGAEFGGFAGPGSAGEAVLGTFLDAGGCLLLTSQDYLFDRGLTTFMQSYLGVASGTNDVTQTTVTGQNSFAGLGPYTLTFIFTNYSDRLTPDGTADLAFLGDVVGEESAAVAKLTTDSTQSSVRALPRPDAAAGRHCGAERGGLQRDGGRHPGHDHGDTHRWQLRRGLGGLRNGGRRQRDGGCGLHSDHGDDQLCRRGCGREDLPSDDPRRLDLGG